MAQEAKVFEHTAKAFQTQVVEFSEKKIALSQEKVELEAQTLVLTEQLTAKEMTQNNAIENEDYEVAESLNEAIANLQTQQSRNASQLRNVGESIDRLRYLPPFLCVIFFPNDFEMSGSVFDCVFINLVFLSLSFLPLSLSRGIVQRRSTAVVSNTRERSAWYHVKRENHQNQCGKDLERQYFEFKRPCGKGKKTFGNHFTKIRIRP